MQTNEAGENTPSVLFVCYGNTCRSPMAEGLAKKRMGGRMRIESAGLAPVFEGAAEAAVYVLHEIFGIDISSHRTRGIADVNLGEFSRIIVLDAYVYETLLRRYPKLAEKFILWDIEDPFGKELDAYRKTADSLQCRIKEAFFPDRHE
jgi:protein-tyrosine-phosphatase